MNHNIYDILTKLSVIEAKTTPVSVKHGLNSQQKSVDQLPALFNPKKISVLTNKTDPTHPMHGKMVGDAVEIDVAQTPLEGAMVNVEEAMLERVKRGLSDYLDSLKNDAELDRKLVNKAKKAIGADESAMQEDPTESMPPPAYTPEPVINPTLPESAVTTIALEDGRSCEIYGNQDQGFEIGRGGRRMKSRFKTLEQATLAVEMYKKRCAEQSLNGDYLDEA
jgi:hypothetical protein